MLSNARACIEVSDCNYPDVIPGIIRQFPGEVPFISLPPADKLLSHRHIQLNYLIDCPFHGHDLLAGQSFLDPVVALALFAFYMAVKRPSAVIHLVHHRVKEMFSGVHCGIILFSGHDSFDIQKRKRLAGAYILPSRQVNSARIVNITFEADILRPVDFYLRRVLVTHSFSEAR